MPPVRSAGRHRFVIDAEIDVAESLILHDFSKRRTHGGGSLVVTGRRRGPGRPSRSEYSDEDDSDERPQKKMRNVRRGDVIIGERHRAARERSASPPHARVPGDAALIGTHDPEAALGVVGSVRAQLLTLDVCYECGSSGPGADFLCCVDCGETFHTFCLDPPLTLLPEDQRAHWRCPDCKLCEICFKGENEDQLLVMFILLLCACVCAVAFVFC